MDKHKIQALKDLGIPEATIQRLLEDVEMTEKAAEADGVRYKAGQPWREQQLADVLTAAVERVEDTIWDAYARGRFRDAAALTSGLLATVKATDPRAACDAAFDALRATSGDDAAANWLKDKAQALAGTNGAARSTVADSGPQGATKTYDVRRDPMAIGAGADQLKGRRT